MRQLRMGNLGLGGTLLEFIREGGWPMFPILGFGAVALILALIYASKPEPGYAALVRTFFGLTLLMGFFGTALGVQYSAEAMRGVAPEHRWIFLLGLAESLHCVIAALALLMPTTIAAGIGHYRQYRQYQSSSR